MGRSLSSIRGASPGASWLARTGLSALAAAALAAAGCVGVLGDSGSSSTSGDPTGEPQTPDSITPFPAAHLTGRQLALTVADLFAPIEVPAPTLPADVAIEGFSNNSSTQTPSAALIEAVHAAAISVATAAMASPPKLLGCTPASRADEDACASQFLPGFLKKAFRRPASADEVQSFVDFYTASRNDGADFPTAMTLVIEAVLEDPAFFYRVEAGTPSPEDPRIARLGPYEVASRLSYFLWGTMPDEALFAAAESGALSTPEGLEKEARRLLDDPRARDSVVEFHREWLRFEKMDVLVKDPALFPDFDASVAAAMRGSAEAFVADAFFQGGSLTTLLTSDQAFVNDTLAPYYGVAPPGSSDLVKVQVDKTQRAGILTHVGLMAGFAHATADSPVLRGVWVLDRWMCNAPPPPPKGVNTTPPPVDPNKAMTTRDRFATQHEQGACAGCHHQIDGIGFAFEHYDAVGKWRTQDVGLPVDATGWFTGAGTDLTGTFDGAVDLGNKLAASKTVQACVAQNWLKYALGVDHSGIGRSQLAPVVQTFQDKKLDLRELVVALVLSEPFQTRVIAP
jgi:hypothetical protein